LKDIDIKYTKTGTAIGRFSLAVNYGKLVNDKWEEEVSYFDFVLWGKRAESLSPYLKKGQHVAVDGILRQNRWKTEKGENRSRVEVVVNNLELLGGKAPRETVESNGDSIAEQFINDHEMPF
jgi:single-strand DNA-binding protein